MGESPLLTKSRLVSISHPHHPSPLGGVGWEEGKGDEVRFQQHARTLSSRTIPQVQGPWRGQSFFSFEPMGMGGGGRISGALPTVPQDQAQLPFPPLLSLFLPSI